MKYSISTLSNLSNQRPQRSPIARAQRGVVLVVALIVLVAMTLAGIAMVRQISSGVGIAGNIGFRQNATSAADYGAEVARAFVTSPASIASGLVNDSAADGYSSSAGAANVDFTQAAAWPTGSFKVVDNPADNTGNKISYQIHRMCKDANKSAIDPTNNCVMAPTVGLKPVTLGAAQLPDPGQPYFRTTVRVQGTRGATSFVQIMSY